MAGTVALTSLAFSEAQRPNIIFLLTDDQSTYSVGCYGNKDVQTPNMDRLGSDGMTFHKHYDTTAICMASRATIMTGMYEYKTGCNFSKGKLTSDKWDRSYPVLLRKVGYLTGFAGKFGFDIDGVEPETAFDVYGGGPGQTNYETKRNKTMAKYADRYPHSTRSYGAFGQDFIEQAVKEEKPFCLSISFKAPHRPTTPDPAYDDVYAGKTFAKPGNFGREHGTHLSEQSRQGRQYERFSDWKYTYWWYSDDSMSPAEELFDTAKDPLELKNLAQNPEYQAVLEEMRKNYDKELAAWKQNAEEKYQPYSTWFDRGVSASSKADLLSRVGNKKDKKKQ